MSNPRPCEILALEPACPFVPALRRGRRLSPSLAAALLAISGFTSGLALAQNDAKPDAKPAAQPADKTTDKPATDSTADTKADPKPASTTEPIELAWKFEEDAPLKLKDTQEIAIAATGMMAMNMNMTVVTESRTEFTKVNDDGSAEATLTFTRITVDGSAKPPQIPGMPAPEGDGKFSFDTKNPAAAKSPAGGGMMGPDSDGLKAFSALIDKPLKFKITKAGLVSDVSGTQAIADQMVAEANAKPAPEWAASMPDMATQMKQQEIESIRKTFSDASMKNLFEEMFRVVPEKATKMKTNWSRPTFGPGMISAIMQGQGGETVGTVNNSIVEYTDSIANIKTATAMTFKAEDMPDEMTIQPLQGTGEIVFDNESGALIESTNDLKTQLTQSFSLGQGAPEQKMVIDISVKTRVEPVIEE